MNRKGIILAGGHGTRLAPATDVISKQLLPIFDKPMIYYPLSTLMIAGIRDILLITSKDQIELFKNLLGNGDHLGISISYAVQEKPNGLAEAFIIGEKFIDKNNCALILGDNIFYGHNIQEVLRKNCNSNINTIFAYRVSDPERSGVVSFDKNQKPISIEEKPKKPKSNYAVTGLYFYENNVIEIAKKLKPSARNELEITDINKIYMMNEDLNVQIFERGIAWLDTGTHESMNDASNFIETIEKRQGLKISCPEEIAWRNHYISDRDLQKLGKKNENSTYGKYLLSLLKE
tara:strand:- start:20 stop:889 length:870 start_codon:yes stop_codon:yes gene_type:complete